VTDRKNSDQYQIFLSVVRSNSGVRHLQLSDDRITHDESLVGL